MTNVNSVQRTSGTLPKVQRVRKSLELGAAIVKTTALPSMKKIKLTSIAPVVVDACFLYLQ